MMDHHPSVLEWSSEEVVVPYRSPVDNEIHRYFTDLWCKIKDENGNIGCYVIEIKPFSQTQQPPKPKRKTKKHINEVMTYAVNQKKWEAAKEYCKKRGWEFKIITEKELFGKL